jgi:hypothetical protein
MILIVMHVARHMLFHLALLAKLCGAGLRPGHAQDTRNSHVQLQVAYGVVPLFVCALSTSLQFLTSEEGLFPFSEVFKSYWYGWEPMLWPVKIQNLSTQIAENPVICRFLADSASH